MKIDRFTAYEVIVPAHDGVIESKGINKLLHKLPVGATSGWSVQFDQLSKLVIKIETNEGIIGWGELYRDHNWSVVESIIQSLLGMDLSSLTLQNFPSLFAGNTTDSNVQFGIPMPKHTTCE